MTRATARTRTKPRLKGKAREARRFLLVGLWSLLPPALYLVLLLGVRGPFAAVQKWYDSVPGSALLVLVGMICPVVTMSCGLGLLRHRGRLKPGIALLIAGALLFAASLIARPS
jgi:hypothetical protein